MSPEKHLHPANEHHEMEHSHMPGLPGGISGPFPYHLSDDAAYEHQQEAHEKTLRLRASMDDTEVDEEEELTFPNPLARIRYQYREYTAEFFATMLMICFGTGVDCQVTLSGLAKGSYLSISFGWGIGVMVGVYMAGGISGGHLNPCVTIALAAFRKFPRGKVAGYIFAQVLGAFCGACIIQGIYSGALNQYEGGTGVRTFEGATATASLFFTAPAAYMTNVACFFNEFLDTAILIMMVFAIGDKNNLPPPSGMAPIVLMFLILGLGAALGWQTAYCLNPARDLGPRMALAALGYPNTIWTDRHAYWIWTPVLATILGGLAGGLTYDIFLYTGEDSWLNTPWGKEKKLQQIKDAAITV